MSPAGVTGMVTIPPVISAAFPGQVFARGQHAPNDAPRFAMARCRVRRPRYGAWLLSGGKLGADAARGVVVPARALGGSEEVV